MTKNTDNNYDALKDFCLKLGVDLFGVADISEIKKEFLISPKSIERFNRAICLGLRLSESVLDEIESAPTMLYSHHYKTLNLYLDQVALKVNNYLQKQGFSALPIPASQILDWQKQKAHLSHKQLGVLAGLGWIGRNNLLVNEALGSQFRLVSILTDMPLKADKPLKKDCAECKLCITICPAQAIKENYLDFEHEKCFQALKEFERKRLVLQYICGVCAKVCRGKKR